MFLPLVPLPLVRADQLEVLPMRRSLLLAPCAAVAVLLSSVAASGAVPQALTEQGRLLDTTGAPVVSSKRPCSVNAWGTAPLAATLERRTATAAHGANNRLRRMGKTSNWSARTSGSGTRGKNITLRGAGQSGMRSSVTRS